MPSINREFGTVILGGQNVAYDVVADGWAKVRECVAVHLKQEHFPGNLQMCIVNSMTYDDSCYPGL